MAGAIAQHQRLVADHNSFGNTSGTGGVDNYRRIIRHDHVLGSTIACVRNLIGQIGKFFIRQRATAVIRFVYCNDPALLKPRVGAACRLRHTKQHRWGRISKNDCPFPHGVPGIKAGPDCANANRCQKDDEEFGSWAGEHGDPVTGCNAQGQQCFSAAVDLTDQFRVTPAAPGKFHRHALRPALGSTERIVADTR